MRSSARWLGHRKAVSEPRFVRQSLVCGTQKCTAVPINRRAATRCKRDWSSYGGWCRGAVAERLLGDSQSW